MHDGSPTTMGEADRLGINLWSQASDWPSFLGGRPAGGRAGLRPHLDVGPRAGDLRRPGPADLRGLHGAGGRRAGDDAGPARPVRRRQHVPQPRSRGQGDRDDRPHQRRPRDHGPRRGVVRRTSTSRSGSTSAVGFGQRLDWLAEAGAAIARDLLDGAGGHGDRARATRSTTCGSCRAPVQAHVPVMIGGGGERKTLRIVARYADMWNVFGTPEVGRPQGRGSCAQHCADVGRDPDADRAHARLQDHDPLDRGGGGAGPPGRARAQPDPAVAGRGRRVVLDRDARADRRDDDRLPEGRLRHVHRRAAGARTTPRRWRR